VLYQTLEKDKNMSNKKHSS